MQAQAHVSTTTTLNTRHGPAQGDDSNSETADRWFARHLVELVRRSPIERPEWRMEACRLLKRYVEHHWETLRGLSSASRMQHLCSDEVYTTALRSLTREVAIPLALARYEAIMERAARRALPGRQELVDDVLQSVRLRLLERTPPCWTSPDFDVRKLRAYLARCAFNEAMTRLRAERRDVPLQTREDDEPLPFTRDGAIDPSLVVLIVAWLPHLKAQVNAEIQRYILEESPEVCNALLAYTAADQLSWSSVERKAEDLGLAICSKANYFKRIGQLRKRIGTIFGLEPVSPTQLRHLLREATPEALALLMTSAMQRAA